MRHLFIVLLLVSCSLISTAQTRVGFQGGIAVASIRAKVAGMAGATEGKVGLTAGVVLQTPISKDFAFRPGLNFTQKGGRTEDGTEKQTITINALEFPMDFVYQTNSGFFIGAGPNFSVALSGKAKITDGSLSEEEKITFGSGEDDMKRLEVSGNLVSGFTFKNGFNIVANYSFGLTNLNNATEDPFFGKITTKGRYFGIRIGYLLPAKGKK